MNLKLPLVVQIYTALHANYNSLHSLSVLGLIGEHFD